jgi:hypothetical protein
MRTKLISSVCFNVILFQYERELKVCEEGGKNATSFLLSEDQLPFERNVVCGKQSSIYSLVVSVSISRYVVAIRLLGWDV